MPDPTRGLDLTEPDVLSTIEAEAFKGAYQTVRGRPHRGLNFWLENAPTYLKRYRAFAELMTPTVEVDKTFIGSADLAFYAMVGYVAGVRDLIRGLQFRGMTKRQCLEALGIAFLHVGPRGSETIAEALEGFDWIEPVEPVQYPEGWAPDPEAFASGLDFSHSDVLNGELQKLEHWYMRTLGEVPRYVRLLGIYNPRLLKAYRARFENCLTELPKQVMPVTLLAYNAIRANTEGIREDILMARAFGVNKELVIRTISRATLYGGIEAAGVVDQAAGDVLAEWDQT